jgi:hypothetical protein
VIDHSHVSDLRFDRWLAGELSTGDAAELTAQAEACATCGARMRELTAGRDAFLLRPIEVSFAPAPVRSVRRGRWLAAAGAALAAAAVVVIVVRRGGGDEFGERPKGSGPNLVLAAGRAPDLVAVSSSDVVHPGDSLQAAYSSKTDGFGAVLSLDGAGMANVYVPSRGDAMVALPAGVDRSFPESTVLDRVVGSERVFVVWCEQAHPLRPLVVQLRAAGELTAPDGCHVRRVVLDKREAR